MDDCTHINLADWRTAGMVARIALLDNGNRNKLMELTGMSEEDCETLDRKLGKWLESSHAFLEVGYN